MKKIIIVAVIMFAGISSFAQFQVGIQGAGTLSTAKVELPGTSSISKKMKFAPGGAIVAQYDFSKKLGIRTGIHYLQNGVTVNTSGYDPENGELGEIKLEAKTTLHYLQVPVNVLYYIPVGAAQLYVGAGPFAGYGISGKTTLSGTYTLPNGSHETVTEKQDAFKKESDGGAGFKRFDWGVGAIAGVKISKWFVQAGYQYSLADTDPNKDSKYKNRSAQISVGYFLF